MCETVYAQKSMRNVQTIDGAHGNFFGILFNMYIIWTNPKVETLKFSLSKV